MSNHDWYPLTDELVKCENCGTIVNEIESPPEEWDGDCVPDQGVE